MKKALLLFVLLMLATMCCGQDLKPSLYVASGFGTPVSAEIKDGWKSGEILEAGFGWVVQPNVELFASFSYNHFRPEELDYIKQAKAVVEENLGHEVDISQIEFGGGADLKIYCANVGAKYYVPTSSSTGRIKPYFVGSVGYEIQDISDAEMIFSKYYYEDLELPDGENGFNLNFGAGFNLDLGYNANLFVEGKYALHFVDPKNLQSFPLTAGFKVFLGSVEE
jgi:hypothetical protein